MSEAIVIGDAAISLRIDEEDFGWGDEGDDAIIGDNRWQFRYRDIRRIQKKMPGALGWFSHEIEDNIATFEEDAEDHDKADGLVELYNTDLAIVILHLMGVLGGDWEVYTTQDCAYWAFHDVCHAQNDVTRRGDGVYWISSITSEVEAEAMLQGAELAKEYGVSVADIARQLVKAENAWHTRFGVNREFLEDFLNRI